MTKVIQGENDLYSQRPDLMQFWDFDKNSKEGLNPKFLTCGSSKKAHWNCEKGHKFERSIYNIITNGFNCPECNKSSNMAYQIRPELLNEWYDETDFKSYKANSHYIATWKCSKCNNIYKAAIYSRAVNKTGCNRCYGRRNKIIYNSISEDKSLIHKFPEIAKEWSKDNIRDINTITYGSHYVAKWVCSKCGHTWETAVSNRTAHGGRGCPKCNGKDGNTALLIDRCPELICQIDINKSNVDITKIRAGSNDLLWWKCNRGHSWKASISSRVHGNGCPHCSTYGTSYPEYFIYDAIKRLYPEAKHRFKINNLEYDIVIPSIKLLIEYNGSAYHKDKADIDQAKTNNASAIGYRLIIIEDNGSESSPKLYGNTIRFKHLAYRQRIDMTDIVNIILDYVGSNKRLNEAGSKIIEAEALKDSNKGCRYDESLGYIRPDLVGEWDNNRNMDLSIYDIKPQSNKKVWWICRNCGKSYNSSPAHRFNGRNCPYCIGRKINSEGEL